MAVAGKDQLSDPERHDANRRRRCFFGDMGGNFYALDANNGRKLWGEKIGGAIGGGVITYLAGQAQRVAAATGLTEVLWPTEITTAKVSILGVE